MILLRFFFLNKRLIYYFRIHLLNQQRSLAHFCSIIITTIRSLSDAPFSMIQNQMFIGNVIKLKQGEQSCNRGFTEVSQQILVEQAQRVARRIKSYHDWRFKGLERLSFRWTMNASNYSLEALKSSQTELYYSRLVLCSSLIFVLFVSLQYSQGRCNLKAATHEVVLFLYAKLVLVQPGMGLGMTCNAFEV